MIEFFSQISEDQITFVITIMALLGITTFLTIDSYKTHTLEVNKLIPTWQSFAEMHKLDFRPTRILKWCLNIQGDYRHHNLSTFTSFIRSSSVTTFKQLPRHRYNRANTSIYTNIEIRSQYLHQKSKLGKVTVQTDTPSYASDNILTLLSASYLLLRNQKQAEVWLDSVSITYRYIDQYLNQNSLSEIVDVLVDISDNRNALISMGTAALPHLQSLVHSNHPIDRVFARHFIEK